MTNPSQHGPKMIRDTSSPHGINKRFMFALDMLWIGGVVFGITEHTIREFRDPACDEMVNVIRDCPDSNRFVPIR